MIYAILIPVGILSGIVSSVAGLASLVSYPALLLLGMPPVQANVANTVSLVWNGIGSVLSSRRELRGQQRELLLILPLVVAGGLTGGLILLAAPSKTFELIVPFFILGAAALIFRPPRRMRKTETALFAATVEPTRTAWWWVAYGTAIFLTGAYGGYFGAAAGVILLALLSSTSDRPFAVSNALRNAAMPAANLTAAILFCFTTSIRWDVVVPLAIGLFIGGYIGPIIFRRLHTAFIRKLIGVLACALAVALFIEAYHSFF